MKNRFSFSNIITTLSKINPVLSFLLLCYSIVSVALTVMTKNSLQPTYIFIRENIYLFWLIFITLVLLTSIASLIRINSKVFYEFRDNFINLDNWDFKGAWRTQDRTLLITGSDEGGITKMGSNWENYTIQFQGRIMSECLGVIVRAKDLYNYYMFQIRADKIRPHYRTINTISREFEEENGVKIFQNLFIYSWEHDGVSKDPNYQAKPITPSLDDWFEVKMIVNGTSIQIYINQKLVLDLPSSLGISSGKIGFRNSVGEEAQIRELRVKLL